MRTMSLAERLREASRTQHASIERALPLTSAALTPDAYRRVLEAFLVFYEPLENALSAVASQTRELDLVGREKRPKLRGDLRILGMSEVDLAATPICDAIPRLDGVPRALGCM